MLRRIVLLVFLSGLLALSILGYRIYDFITKPPETEGRSIYFDVPPGAKLSTISLRLAANRLITNPFFFTVLVRLQNKQGALQSGRFALKTNMRPLEVLHVLVAGKPVLYRITIPEGLPWWKTAQLLADNGFVSYDDFRSVIFNAAFCKKYGIPFQNAEGFLMPDTYYLKKEEQAFSEDFASANQTKSAAEIRKKHAERIAARLVDTFWKKAAHLWPNAEKPKQQDLKRILILASIVEKETRVEMERPRVAGVYTNRLAKNMLLQADPTVIYGLGAAFSGKLLYKHLNDPKNTYNTYKHAGLPPGPICSFGMDALKAALYPEEHAYFYFVAKGTDGSHVFSETLQKHTKAVEEYRRIQRQK